MQKPTLQEQLKAALESLEYWKKHYESENKSVIELTNKLWAANSELETLRREMKAHVSNNLIQETRKTEMLLEIIRWQVNPETAKDPFNNLERHKNNIPPGY